MRRIGLLLGAALALIACDDSGVGSTAAECRIDRDCSRGQMCLDGLCRTDRGRDGGAVPVGDAALEMDAAAPDAASGPDMAPAPDLGPPEPDTAQPEQDMGRPEPDFGPPEPDMAPPEPDMAPPEPDMAPPEPDMAPPEPDMGSPEMDMSPPEPDMAPPEPDMAPPEPDMAPPEPDMAPPEPDMAPPEPDMAPPEPDMGPPEMDMAPPEPDMAPPEPDMGPPEMDMAPPEPDMAPPPRLGYGEPCAAAADCESDVCVNDPDRGGVCSRACNVPADCPDLDVCLLAENGAGVCFRNETGDRCRNGADCIDGICLTPPDPVPWAIPQPVCVNRCVDDRKCPAGFGCRVVDTDRGPARVCAPDTVRVDTCPNGTVNECLGTCAVPPGRDPLDIHLCINVDANNGPGYCSCTCASSADCPAGFGCARIPELELDPRRPGLCLAMSGYRCPVQSLGAEIEQCLSLTCLPAGPDPDEAFCSVPCGNDFDCPAGFECAPVDDTTWCVAVE